MTAETTPSMVCHDDGRVDLSSAVDITDSPLYNHDLAPVPVSERKWTAYNYAALWGAMSACIPTYMLSSGLIASGMNWWQALFTILLGNVIVLVPIILNSHPGTKYGIPFPVLARASYGTAGSNLPALMRALVACGWFGIQAWIGGQALNLLFRCTIPGWSTMLGGHAGGHTQGEWLSFALFWLLNELVIFKGMELLKKVQAFAAPFVIIMTGLLVVWAVNQAHGLGTILHDPGKFHSLRSFLPVFLPSLTGMIAFWATLSLNMPDFTRFGRSQREQAFGQMVALPAAMTIFSAMGIVITSAAVIIYPTAPLQELWDPVKLIGKFNEPWLVAISMFTVVVATLSVNTAANVVSPANDFANAFPRFISFRTGGLLTGVLGIIMQPWHWLADPNGYIFQWLVGYSGGLGSIAGVMIADYWLLRKTSLKLADLYRTQGEYSFQSGWNWKAVCATLVGCGCAWIGAFVPALHVLYDCAWVVGFVVSLGVYYSLSKAMPPNMMAHQKGE